jgi:hypothetical protein
MKKLFFASSLLISALSYGVERIGAVRFNRGAVSPIYLAPGLGSMILFPCPLVEVFIGRSEDLKSQISPSDKKTLFLNLKLNSSLPTNVLARCEGERNVFVFDVIPSKAKHQDFVEIKSAYGGPGLKEFKTSQSSLNPRNKLKVVMQKPELIEKGKGQ